MNGEREREQPGGAPAMFDGGRLTASQAMAESPNPEWLAEFEAAARRPLAVRWRYAFIHTQPGIAGTKHLA